MTRLLRLAVCACALAAAGPALAAHRVGLVVAAEGAPTWVRDQEGVLTRLRTAGVAAPLAYLDGCIVELDGPMLFGRMFVRDWRVLDAGDGSGDFVGMLRAYGARLLLDDRNTGSTLVLDDGAVSQLRPYVGFPVLVIGHITGAGYVVPVAFRVLAPTR